MKKTIKNTHLQMMLEPSCAGNTCIFLNLSGNSYSAITTKKGAKSFAKYLREAAKWVDSVTNEVGTERK